MSLYKKLLKAGCSILAFDYRGFADSTDIYDINETTLVYDATVALQYVRWVLKIFLRNILTPGKSLDRQKFWCGLTPWVLGSLAT